MSKINNKTIYFGLKTLTIIIFAIFILATPLESNASTYSNNGFYRTFKVEEELSNPKPHISSITPKSIDGTKNKVTITIIGSGFVPDSIVRKNNSDRRTTFIDSKHLLVDIYASDMYNQSEFYLTVFNPKPEGGYSNASLFTIKNNTTTTRNTTTTANTTTINNSSNQSGSTSNTTSNSSYNYNSSNNTSDTNNTISSNDFNESYGSVTANALLGGSTFMPSGLTQWILLILIIIAIIFLWRYVHRSEEIYMSEPLKHA